MKTLQHNTRDDLLAFFSPKKKTHQNRMAKLVPQLLYWSRHPEVELYSQAVDDIFSRSELGRQFKSALLVETNSSYSNAERAFCKKYKVNKQNLIEILKRSDEVANKQEPAICIQVFADEDEALQHWTVRYYRCLYADQLSGKKPFTYMDRSYRKWHPLQNVRRSHKGQIFEGYLEHDYDISTALISVMLGDVQRLDPTFDMSKYELIYRYRDNKAIVRQNVGELLDLDPDQVKELFSYINNNGIISASPFMALLGIVGSKEKVGEIRRHKFFQQYRIQIKSLWRMWVYFNNRQVYWRNDKDRPLVANKKRFNLYFFIERKLLDVIEEYLQSKSVVYFLEHDGFRSSLPIDKTELEQTIKDKIQIEVNIENKSASSN